MRARLGECQWYEKIRVGKEIELSREDGDDAQGFAVGSNSLPDNTVGRCVLRLPQTMTDRDDRLGARRELRRNESTASLRVKGTIQP